MQLGITYQAYAVCLCSTSSSHYSQQQIWLLYGVEWCTMAFAVQLFSKRASWFRSSNHLPDIPYIRAFLQPIVTILPIAGTRHVE